MNKNINSNKKYNTIKLSPPTVGDTIIYPAQSATGLQLGFTPDQDTVKVSGKDLVFTFPGGGSIVVASYFGDDKTLPSFILEDGKVMSAKDFSKDFTEMESAVEEHAEKHPDLDSGINEYQDDPGDLIDTVSRLGKLGTIYWDRETEPLEEYKGFGRDDGGRAGISLPDDPDPIQPVVRLSGTLRVLLSMHEDGKPLKYVATDSNDPHSPGNGGLEYGFHPATGMPIQNYIEGGQEARALNLSLDSGGSGPDAIYVHCFTPTKLPDPSQGIILYNGVPLQLGVTIDVPDLNAFTFLPAPYYSGAVVLEFTYQLCSDATGPETYPQEGVAVLVVDSVADLASASSEATGQTATPDQIGLDEAVISQGWATQHTDAQDAVRVTFTITAQFYDLDGSEIAWIDIALPQGFSIPEGSNMVLIVNEHGTFARIMMPDLTTLVANNGVIDVPVTLVMDNTADTLAKNLTINVCTQETDGLDGAGFKTENNQATRTITQEIEVDLLPGAFTVQAGWAYEGGKGGGTATGDISTIGLDENSTGTQGAPIVFTLENGSFTGGTITIDPECGTLYFGATPLTPDANGMYTLTAAQLTGGQLYFLPKGYTDGDVPMTYSLHATMDNGTAFTFTGETTLVVDAVADAAAIHGKLDSVADESDSASMIVTVKAAFADVDGSENHYVLVEWIEGWTSADPHELVTVYFDEYGKPMQPTGILPDGSGYAYDGAAYSKTYFRFDVTEESINQAQGNPHEYSFHLTPPDTAGDIDLAVLTVAEEKIENLSGREYDVANNVAYTEDTVHIDLADATVTMTATDAYENHSPEQHLGIAGGSDTTDGVITVSLENNGDTINNAEGGRITLTFTYDGPDGPGSFTCGITGQTYVFGESANYTLVPGTTNQYRIVIDLDAGTLPSGTTSFTLQYNPPLNDDTDLTGLLVTLPVVSQSGHTREMETSLDRLNVDAVANMPESVTVAPVYSGDYTAATSGGTIGVTVNVQFDDYDDDSEQHYLVFDLNSGFASIDLASFPAGSVVELTAEQILALGLPYTDGDRYIVLQVSNEYLRDHDGTFTATIQAGLDTVEVDSTLDLTFLAVSVDTPSDAGEITDANNIAVAEGTVPVQVNTVTSELSLSANRAFENGTPQAHLGNENTDVVAGAGAITISGLDAGEVLTSLTITWAAEAGELLYNGLPIQAGDTVIGGTILRYDPENGTLTIFSSSGTTCVSSDVNNLSFLPAYNYSDQDVPLGYSGTIVDSASGMSQDFVAEEPVIVVVDAVAQKPTDVDASVGYQVDGEGEEYAAAGETITITAQATFRDTGDGSEKHYLLIQVKSYFDYTSLLGVDGMDRVLVAFDANGNPLTPSYYGGYLDPNQTSDVGMVPNGSAGFIQIPVDHIIAQFKADGEPTQSFGNFTVTLNADGSFTVSYSLTMDIIPGAVKEDITNDTLLVGGMSEETATIANGDGSDGKESHHFNNNAYDFTEVQVNVAVVQTTDVNILTGWAYEKNKPHANVGSDEEADGAGILAVRTASTNGDHSSEQITVTFTYNALYQDETGEWVLPGTIVYTFPGGLEPVTTIDPATGVVTVVVVISTGDTASILASGDVSKDSGTKADQIDESHIRFIPSDTYNEADVKLNYTVDVTETASGATSESVGGGSSTVIIDAVADKPVISDVSWSYNGVDGGGDYIAFPTGEVVLTFTVAFPDTGTNGVLSEGQYILIKQNTDMDLSPEFIAKVRAAGYEIESYVIAGDPSPYYRIPAAFFEVIPGTHTYKVSIPMIMTADLREGSILPDLVVVAQAVVETTHGKEVHTSNNVATENVDVPELNFAFISTYVEGGKSYVYEGNTPNAHKGDYTPGEGVEFSLGLKVGGSIADGGKEIVSDIVFTYDEDHGTLFYHDGETWVQVRSGGSVPPEHSDTLKYMPKDVRDTTGDLDQKLHYSLTVTEPATGAEKVIEGDYTIIVDAVAEQPTDINGKITGYSNDNGYIEAGESVDITLSANFPDFVKGDHSDHYFLVQVPGEGWTTDYPGAEIYIYDGVAYFRIPVDPSNIDASGNASIDVTLTAPLAGYMIYGNADPLKIGALTIARDPNGNSQPAGDGELTYNNNWAYSELGGLDIEYKNEETFFSIDILYENNNPRGNELDSEGRPVEEEAGGKVNLNTTYNGEDVEYVRLTWDTSMGDLYIDGQPVSPTMIDGQNGYYDIPASKFNDLYFRCNNTNNDTDWPPVTAEIFGKGGVPLGKESWTPLVDAVAQVPTDVSAGNSYNEDGSTSYTAATPGEETVIVVKATFHDLEGGSERFMLVEAQPGWSLPDGVEYTIITAPDGKQYFQIPVPDSAIDPLTGEATMEITVITPKSGGTETGPGITQYELNTGAMTVRDPSDAEYVSDNNVSYNLNGSVTITTSEVVSDLVLKVTSTYAATDLNGDGNSDPDYSASIYVDGLVEESDYISEITLTYSNENGVVTYNGVSFTEGSWPGVTVTTQPDGTVTVVITNAEIINALTSGTADSSAVRYTPETYNDYDVEVGATFVVHDKNSPDTQTQGNDATIIVDAVALQPTDVSMAFSEDYNGACGPGETVTFSVTATFHDMDNPNAQHYLGIQDLGGWDFDGPLPAGVTIESYNGVTYYVINIEAALQANSPYLIDHGNGTYTFSLSQIAPENFSGDAADVDSILGGAVVVVGSHDREVTYDNNTAVAYDKLHIDVGVVTTETVTFLIEPVVEDSAIGAVITLNQATLNELAGGNERVTQTQFSFKGDFTGYAAGEQVGTIIYNGVAHKVIANGNGTASVLVDFGSGGYDPSADFRLIWGTVATNPDGRVQYGSDGYPVVVSWNHTGSEMTVTTSSTVVDNASQDTVHDVGGSGKTQFVPTADAPTDIQAQNPGGPVSADSEVSFTVSGKFVDIDGSEKHYFLVEQLPGWTGSYDVVDIGGTKWFKVPVPDNKDPNPTVTVTLTPPADIAEDTAYSMKIGGLSEDGSSTAQATDTTTVSVNVTAVEPPEPDISGASAARDDFGDGAATQAFANLLDSPDTNSLAIMATEEPGGDMLLDGDLSGLPVSPGPEGTATSVSEDQEATGLHNAALALEDFLTWQEMTQTLELVEEAMSIAQGPDSQTSDATGLFIEPSLTPYGEHAWNLDEGNGMAPGSHDDACFTPIPAELAGTDVFEALESRFFGQSALQNVQGEMVNGEAVSPEAAWPNGTGPDQPFVDEPLLLCNTLTLDSNIQEEVMALIKLACV